MKKWIGLACLLIGPVVTSAHEGAPAVWKDPSPHKVRWVTVEPQVTLEVLDWGGKGQAVVLLAGLGGTAHIFDDFAPKLVKTYRVYAITRRGYGASSAPEGGYEADRMGDDVLAVLDALKIRKPVLIGHSFGGSDVSSVASRFPERIAGGIYLDCDSYAYAINREEMLYDNPQWRRHLTDLQRKLAELGSEPRNSGPLAQELLKTNLPEFQRDLAAMAAISNASRPALTMPSETDLRDWPAALAWYRRTHEADLEHKTPESEWRQVIATTPDGRPQFAYRVNPRIPAAITRGERRYENIPVKALLIIRSPKPTKEPQSDDLAKVLWEVGQARAEGRADAFRRAAPQGRVVLLPGANHYVYLSNEKDVLKEIHGFIDSLHSKSGTAVP